MSPSGELDYQESAVRLFVSYSHNDAYWIRNLMPLLSFRGVYVRPWSDENIEAGTTWDEEIRRELAEMHVFIPLVSVHFAASRYIRTVECPIAKKRHKNGEIEVVPVLVHHPGKGECGWLMALQCMPPGEQSWAEVVRGFQLHDMALAPIRDGIRDVVKRARARRKTSGCPAQH